MKLTIVIPILAATVLLAQTPQPPAAGQGARAGRGKEALKNLPGIERPADRATDRAQAGGASGAAAGAPRHAAGAEGRCATPWRRTRPIRPQSAS